jgi:hypothetical protein
MVRGQGLEDWAILEWSLSLPTHSWTTGEGWEAGTGQNLDQGLFQKG